MKLFRIKKKFKNKKVLITGHNGFKGTWLSLWLFLLGAKVYGISLKNNEKRNHFNLIKKKIKIKEQNIDIADNKRLSKYIRNLKPDFVFHLAAQSLVFKSVQDPLRNWNSNVIGFMNVLISLNSLKKNCIGIFITSDKCYKNLNKNISYKENDELGGIDPYSASKASAEILFHSFFKTFVNKKNKYLRICSARAGNVIGGGDWSEKRLIPDCMKKWLRDQTPLIRNPNATRPWQHVMEAIYGYLVLAVKLSENKSLNGQNFNFSSDKIKNASVKIFLKRLRKKLPNFNWKLERKNKFYESKLLQLNNSKAKKILKWEAKLNLSQTIELLTEWYIDFKRNKKIILNTSIKQIEFYSGLIK
tara:strand:+ start:1064 stop:2140 length:1077 start_codon:yes stop_codon:yes gene_type:complete